MTATVTITPTPQTVQAAGALSDQILQAARAVLADHPCPVYYGPNPWAAAGVKNAPLLILLDLMVGAIEPLANAIADNAWDDQQPIPAAGAKEMAQQLHRIADTITAAASAPDASAWSLPSCTGKELV